MTRLLRIEYAKSVYHVTSRGNERKSVFRSDEDRQKFLNVLQHVNKRYSWICHAYCLMDNHYHLLIWNEVRGQAVLGEESFADQLVDHLRRHKDVPDIPRSQRYADWPLLDRVFTTRIRHDRQKRDRKITEAVEKSGYTQRAIVRHFIHQHDSAYAQ